MAKADKKNNNSKDNSELVEKLVLVNKVSKTVKGGKNFSFAALVIVGDKNGRVGYGQGKAKEVISAKNKALKAAEKSLIKISLKEGRTIHHDVKAKLHAALVVIRSAPPGTGVIAGGAMRAIFECVGIKDVVAKSIGTSNPYNMVAATFKALQSLVAPRVLADRRSKEISEIIRKRNIVLDLVNDNKNNNKNDNKS